MPASRTFGAAVPRLALACALLLAAPAAGHAAQSPRAPRVAHIAVPGASQAPGHVDVGAVVAHHRALSRKHGAAKRRPPALARRA